MEKLKFGLQLAVLLLAFPVWFVAEIRQTGKTVQAAAAVAGDSKKPVNNELKRDISSFTGYYVK